jgi:hydroxypyruvate isomerase
MRLSACVETLFVREHAACEDRIRAAAEAQLDSVEFWLWRDKDLDRIERALGDTGIGLTLFSAEPRSPIVDRATHREFIDGVRESLAVARRLKASALCVLADDRGVSAPMKAPRRGVTRAEQHDAVVAALKLAAPMAADAGVLLLVEPLNSKVDHVGYFLDRTSEGLDVIEEVAHPAVRLLYDVYHSTMMGEKSADTLGDRGRLVGHVHVADVPGRHEPGSGTINWPDCLDRLAAKDYCGAIGLEFWPTGTTLEALSATRQKLIGGAMPEFG